jgi:hypothetical protein
MEALNAMFIRADEHGLLRPLDLRSIKYKVSLYADDVVLFLQPCTRDMTVAKTALNCFEGATGLTTNLAKCSLTPIICIDEQMQEATDCFPCKISKFPCKYLGIPLSIRKLSKAEEQQIVNKVADRLPSWMGRLLSITGRLVLTKVTLTSLVIYPAMALQLSPWAIGAIEKLRRAFLWNGSDHYVKTSNRSHNICNGPLTPVTSTHICNGCCLAPVTYKRARTTTGLASTTPVTNVDFW